MTWKPWLHLGMIACLAISGTAPTMAQYYEQPYAQPMQPTYGGGRNHCTEIYDYQTRMRCLNGPTQRQDDNGVGAAMGAGIVGLALGAIIIGAASAANKGQQAASEYDRWVAYCRSKYRSFDAASGTFLRSDGRRQQCQ